MARAKPILAALADLEPAQYADLYALLVERSKGATREGKPYFACRFRDARRSASVMVWADGGLFEDCESHWHVGRSYKIRAVYSEHEKYGPQLDVEQIREAVEADREHGYDPLALVERSRFEPDAMMAHLRTIVETEIADCVGSKPAEKMSGVRLEIRFR